MKIWQFIKDNALRLVAGAAILFVIFLLALFSGLEPMYGIWILLSLLVAGLLGAALVWSVFHREDAVEEDDDLEIEAELTQLAEGFPLPFAVLEEDGQILAANEDMAAIFGQSFEGKKISAFFSAFCIHQKHQEVQIHGCHFDAFCSPAFLREDGENIYYLTLTGSEEKASLKRQLEEEKSVCGYLYVDNYDEVAEGLDDAQISILTALLGKKLTAYVGGVGGIVKRFEKGRYLLVLSNKALKELMAKKFDILNDIKQTKAGSHIPVTVSIGLGVSGESLEEATKAGKAAIDLALGRGGDQAIIKEGDKYHFFGGKSSEFSHNTKVRARVKADALEGLIRGAGEVFLMGHKNPDFDALGACMGLYRIAADLGKEAHIILNHPSAAVEPLYRTIRQEKAYHDLFCTGQQALDRLTETSLVIVADTYVNALVEDSQVVAQASQVVVIDHHRKSADYIQKAVLVYHEPYASSTAELVTEIIRNLDDKVTLRAMEADGLLSGIMLDTKSFSVKTGAVTFEAAAYLRRNNGDSGRVKQFFRTELDQMKLRAVTISQASFYRDGIVLSQCQEEGPGAALAAAQAADELLEVRQVAAAIVVCRMGANIYVSARSYGDINVQMLMEKAGGGGHRTMAGAQFQGKTISEAMQAVKQAVDDYFEEVTP